MREDLSKRGVQRGNAEQAVVETTKRARLAPDHLEKKGCIGNKSSSLKSFIDSEPLWAVAREK